MQYRTYIPFHIPQQRVALLRTKENSVRDSLTNMNLWTWVHPVRCVRKAGEHWRGAITMWEGRDPEKGGGNREVTHTDMDSVHWKKWFLGLGNRAHVCEQVGFQMGSFLQVRGQRAVGTWRMGKVTTEGPRPLRGAWPLEEFKKKAEGRHYWPQTDTRPDKQHWIAAGSRDSHSCCEWALQCGEAQRSDAPQHNFAG